MDGDGQIVELPEENEVVDTDDGGAIVRTEEESPEGVKDFYQNLAETLDPTDLNALSSQLIEEIRQDKVDRAERDKQQAEGIRRTGLGDDAPGGSAFPGSSRTVHPMLSKGCVDFASRAIREIVQPQGIVKDFIPGTPNKQRIEKAKRQSAYMNWQLKQQMPEFRSELEQLLTQLGLGGSQYLFFVYDHVKKRPVPAFWPIDDVLLPFAANNFYTSDRVTMVERITQIEFDRRVRAGIYRDVAKSASVLLPDTTESEKASEKIEGKSPSSMNEDGIREIFRVFTYADLEGDDLRPYWIELDSSSHEILSVVRNWEMEDQTFQPMHWLIDFTFIPWRGAVGIGLTHLIGSLSASATGAIRALLDSAHINNLPTLLKLKGSAASGQSLNLNAAGVTEVSGGVNSDDIRKLIMAIPFNPPSVVLLQLLGYLGEEADSVVRTTFEKLTESGRPDMPVGTTLALIEQGMKVISAIYLRLYDSMTRVVQVLHRINRMYLTDQLIKEQLGEQVALARDFKGPLDVIPVADPEIFSDAQRFAQIQMVAQRAAMYPQLYDARKVELLILNRTKLPNAEELLIPAPVPEEMNAVNENVAMSLGRPTAAFPEQDHLAHLQVLFDFASSPLLGSSQLIAPAFAPAALQHAKEHILLYYANTFAKQLESETSVALDKLMSERDTETRAELDKTLAAMSPEITQGVARQFEKAQPLLQQLQTMAEQFAQTMQPQDPRLAAAQIKAQSDAQKTQARSQEVQLKEAGDTKRTEMKIVSDLQQTEAEIEAKRAMNTDDNLTALTIAQAETISGEKVAMETGTGINPGE